MSLRPIKHTYILIHHRVMGQVLDLDDGTTQLDRYEMLLRRVGPITDIDDKTWNADQQAAWTAVQAIESALTESSNPSNFTTLNDDLEQACENAGL